MNKKDMQYIVVFIDDYKIKKMKGRDHLSPNIQVWEIAHEGQEIVLVSQRLVEGIQRIRDKRGQINIRGNRSISYNATLPGAWEDSEHLYGEGWDIDCPHYPSELLAIDLENEFGYPCNIGIYDTYCHIGIRGFHRRKVY